MMITLLTYQEYIEIEVISASDQISNTPFLRNEVSKIFEEIFYDDVIYRNSSNLCSNEDLKNLSLWLGLTSMIFLNSDSVGVSSNI